MPTTSSLARAAATVPQCLHACSASAARVAAHACPEKATQRRLKSRVVTRNAACQAASVGVSPATSVLPEQKAPASSSRRAKQSKSSKPGATPACPRCGGPATQPRGFLLCQSQKCEDALAGELLRFIRACLPQCGVGKEFVGYLICSGLVRDIGDLYTLTQKKLATADQASYHHGQLLPGYVPLMGPVRGQKLLASLEASKQLPFITFLQGFGINKDRGVSAIILDWDQFGSLAGLARAALAWQRSELGTLLPDMPDPRQSAKLRKALELFALPRVHAALAKLQAAGVQCAGDVGSIHSSTSSPMHASKRAKVARSATLLESVARAKETGTNSTTNSTNSTTLASQPAPPLLPAPGHNALASAPMGVSMESLLLKYMGQSTAGSGISSSGRSGAGGTAGAQSGPVGAAGATTAPGTGAAGTRAVGAAGNEAAASAAASYADDQQAADEDDEGDEGFSMNPSGLLTEDLDMGSSLLNCILNGPGRSTGGGELGSVRQIMGSLNGSLSAFLPAQQAAAMAPQQLQQQQERMQHAHVSEAVSVQEAYGHARDGSRRSVAQWLERVDAAMQAVDRAEHRLMQMVREEVGALRQELLSLRAAGQQVMQASRPASQHSTAGAAAEVDADVMAARAAEQTGMAAGAAAPAAGPVIGFGRNGAGTAATGAHLNGARGAPLASSSSATTLNTLATSSTGASPSTAIKVPPSIGKLGLVDSAPSSVTPAPVAVTPARFSVTPPSPDASTAQGPPPTTTKAPATRVPSTTSPSPAAPPPPTTPPSPPSPLATALDSHPGVKSHPLMPSTTTSTTPATPPSAPATQPPALQQQAHAQAHAAPSVHAKPAAAAAAPPPPAPPPAAPAAAAPAAAPAVAAPAAPAAAPAVPASAPAAPATPAPAAVAPAATTTAPPTKTSSSQVQPAPAPPLQAPATAPAPPAAAAALRTVSTPSKLGLSLAAANTAMVSKSSQSALVSKSSADDAATAAAAAAGAAAAAAAAVAAPVDSTTLQGKKIAFTGLLDTPRGELERLLAAAGASLVSPSHIQLALLVVGRAATKQELLIAKKRGAEMCKEAAFLRRYFPEAVKSLPSKASLVLEEGSSTRSGWAQLRAAGPVKSSAKARPGALW